MKIRSKKYILLISFVVAAITMVGCMSTATNPTSVDSEKTLHSTMPTTAAEINKLLPANVRVAVRNHAMSVNTTGTTTATIYPSETEQMILIGSNGLKFPANTVTYPTTITVSVPGDEVADVYTDTYLDGSKVVLSFSDITFDPTSQTLAAYFWNEDLQMYVYEGGEVDLNSETITITMRGPRSVPNRGVMVWIIAIGDGLS